MKNGFNGPSLVVLAPLRLNSRAVLALRVRAGAHHSRPIRSPRRTRRQRPPASDRPRTSTPNRNKPARKPRDGCS